MELNKQQKKQLKAIAHKIKPVVTVGQHGMKESINDELEIAIEFHQLIKLKVSVGDRDARDAIIEDICKKHRVELVQRVGNIAILYKRNFDKTNLLAKK